MSDLTDKIRAKFPKVYDDMDDATLESAILSKHPEYKDLATKPAASQQSKPVSKPVASPSALQMGRQSAALNNVPEKAPKLQHEPDTYNEGWWKGLADYARDFVEPDWLKSKTMNPMIQATAHPQTTGDFLGLLLPTMPEAMSAIQGLRGANRLENVVKASTKLVEERPFPSHVLDEAGRDLGAFDTNLERPSGPHENNTGNARPVFKEPEDVAFEVASRNKNMGLPLEEKLLPPRRTADSWREFVEKDLPPNPDLELAQYEDTLDRPMSVDDRAKANQFLDEMETSIDKPNILSKRELPADDYSRQFDAAKNKQVNKKLTDNISNLTPEEINQLDSFDDFGKPLNREDRGLEPAEQVFDASKIKYGTAEPQGWKSVEKFEGDANFLEPKELPKPIGSGSTIDPVQNNRQPNMFSSVDNPDFPPPEMSTSGGSGTPPSQPPPEQQKLLTEENNWKPEESNLLHGFQGLIKGLKSVDLPGITSAAFRQGGKLQGTRAWFKAWIPAAKAFGSKELANSVDLALNERPLVKNGFLKSVGLDLTDNIHREEQIARTEMAEKIPVYGRYIAASNRSYQAFSKSLRIGTAEKFFSIADKERKAQSLWNKGSFGLLGESPKSTSIYHDLPASRQIADAVNTLTHRGRVGFEFGRTQYNAPAKAVEILNNLLWTPKGIASNIRMLNPNTYIFANPLVRRQYMAGILRQTVGWWALSETAKYADKHVSVSTDPTSADYGKIKIGNTRIDPPGGMQQYLVLGARLAKGGTTSSTSNKFTQFGKGPFSSSPTELAGDFVANRADPTIQLAGELANILLSVQKKGTAGKTELIAEQALQSVLPMYAADIAAVLQEDPSLAPWLAPTVGVASSLGMGVNSYGSKDIHGKSKPIDRPVFTPLTGIDFGR